jgi:hypothetical protein
LAKLSIFIPFPESIRRKKEQNVIADAILTHIIGRTMAGRDKENRKFPRYSEKYAEVKGVGRSDVDLVLSGEMLTELKVLKSSADGVEIGYSGAKKLIGKVEGNILGTYGQPEPIPGKKRDFLGIPQDDLDVIISALQEEDEELELTEDDIDRLAREAAREILGDIEFDTDINGE